MNLTHTIDVFEVLWVGLALVGIRAHARGRARAGDLIVSANAAGVNGSTAALLKGWRQTEFWRLVKQVLLGSVGALVMFLPPAPLGTDYRLFVSLYSRFAFITAEAIMVWLSLRAYARSERAVPRIG